MSEVGDVIAAVPDRYVGESEVRFSTASLDVAGDLVGIFDEENDGQRVLVVESDGTTYHLGIRERMAGDGVTEWVPDPVKTSAGIELGQLQEITVEPPDDDEDCPEDTGVARDDEDDEKALTAKMAKEGTDHRGGKATRSLADRRSARDARAENYSGSAPASEVRDDLRAGGTANAVVREFKRLVSEEIRITDRVGERLDVRNVIRFMAGDDTVFDDLWSRAETEDPGDRVVGIALDMSGSIGMADAEGDVKAAVGALALAATAVDDKVVATAFPQGRRKSALLTGPYEPWRWSHLDATSSGGGTPMLPALRDAVRLMRPLSGRERVLFAITDGRPSKATEVADLVEDLRIYGTAVVGFGFGNVDESTLAEIFGDDGYRHVGVDDLPRALVSAYLDQLELDETGHVSAD